MLAGANGCRRSGEWQVKMLQRPAGYQAERVAGHLYRRVDVRNITVIANCHRDKSSKLMVASLACGRAAWAWAGSVRW
jgi:hypothetical protein